MTTKSFIVCDGCGREELQGGPPCPPPSSTHAEREAAYVAWDQTRVRWITVTPGPTAYPVLHPCAGSDYALTFCTPACLVEHAPACIERRWHATSVVGAALVPLGSN